MKELYFWIAGLCLGFGLGAQYMKQQQAGPQLVTVAQNSGHCGHCGETTIVTIREKVR